MNHLRSCIARKLFSLGLGLTFALSNGFSVTPDIAFAESASLTTAKQIIATGKRYLGVPYELGGQSPSAFDCQGFTRFVFAKYGFDMPIGARRQATVGSFVSRDRLQQGDLVFFSTKATMKYSSQSIKRIGHVGIYMGNGKVLHTYGEPGVTITDLDSPWMESHYVTARRIL